MLFTPRFIPTFRFFLVAFFVCALSFGVRANAESAAATPHAGAEAHAAEGHAASDEINVSEILFHHVLESHDWHFTDIPVGEGKFMPIAIKLPWILYSKEKGLDVFMLPGHDAEFEAGMKAKGYEVDHHNHGKVATTASGAAVYDFSLSKTPLQMLIIAILLYFVFSSVAAGYKKNAGKAPSGLQAFMEPIIVFVRDEIAKPNLHGKHEKFVPYLLTLFFFIWFSDLFGLTPLNSNIMGNVSITIALALLTFLIVQFNGTKDYWGHIFWFPGVPFFVKLIMLPVELIGLFIKPVSLLIRLFANIAAGHFMVLALISLIFMLGANGKNVAGALGIMPLSLAFTLFIMTLEILVAILQAYVFTLLTAVFLGAAMESHSHDHDHAHDHAH